ASRRRHTRFSRDWSSDVCSSDLLDNSASDAGWSSLAARRAHNPKVAGSNPAPATSFIGPPEALKPPDGAGKPGFIEVTACLDAEIRLWPDIQDKGPIGPFVVSGDLTGSTTRRDRQSDTDQHAACAHGGITGAAAAWHRIPDRTRRCGAAPVYRRARGRGR